MSESWIASVEAYEGEVNVADYKCDCVDVPRFLTYCQACRNYGKVWSCPSFDFSAEKVWDKYKTLRLLGRKIMFTQEGQDQEFPPEQLGRISKDILRPVQEKLMEELLELEKQYPGSMALGAGSCEACRPAVCARAEGKPCRRPDRMRYSIEALGGDVSLTARTCLGQEILWGKAGHLPPYYLLVGGLLIP